MIIRNYPIGLTLAALAVCRGRPCASPMPRQGQYAEEVVAEICPDGQSGWHGTRPYTDGHAVG